MRAGEFGARTLGGFMKTILFCALSLVACGCYSSHRSHDPQAGTGKYGGSGYDDVGSKSTNKTGTVEASSPTYSHDQADRNLAQQIRQALNDDESLAASARQVEILVNHGSVTLRGTVLSSDEKQRIEEKVKHCAGVNNVDNQLQVRSGSAR
jgi:hypothetical protein